MEQDRKAEKAPVSDATTKSGSKPTITTEEVTIECVDCAEDFDGVMTIIGDRKIVPNLCGDCAKGPDDPDVSWSPTMLESVLARCGVNLRTPEMMTLESWEGSAAVRADCRTFVTASALSGLRDHVRGVYLLGPTGSGKTHLAVGIMRLLAESMQNSGGVLFVRTARLITDIQDTYGTGSTGKILDRMERAGLLVLDDLGAEKATSDVLRILADLFSAREGHPTVVTSNYDPNQLVERWGGGEFVERLASRLGPRNLTHIRVEGDDRRFS